MNALIIFLIVFTFSWESFQDDKISYDSYKVLRLTPKSAKGVKILRDIEETNNVYDFWTSVNGIGYSVDVMIPPHHEHILKDRVTQADIDIKMYISDVQKLIDEEKPKTRKRSIRLEWTNYYELEEINQFLMELADQYPDKVSFLTAGKSYEGRDIHGVKVSFKAGNENRTVFIESNIHAREWITSAVGTWILNEILISNDTDVRRVAESHDWYFVPVFNPDGFAYTHSRDRMWRKTRRPYFLCFGVDPNRNWDYHYNDGGTSGYPCSNNYRGPRAFSETSTRTLSEFISTVGPQLKAYIALHSYSQLMLIPYGFSPQHLDNYQDLYDVGLKAAQSLAQRYNTQYRVGNIVELLYYGSGGSIDWVKGTFGTPITYAYELRDTGLHGFLLPPEQIIPCAEETLDSLVTVLTEFDNLTKKV